jgi:glycosyltransferase involved in cell wall biosynthesis
MRPPPDGPPGEPGTLSVRMTIARARTVTGIDRALRRLSRPRLRPLPPLPPGSTSVLLYSPSNLNQVDGSAIWVRSVVDTLLVDPSIHVTLPLRAPVRRDVITGPLRALDRVELIDIHPRIAARNLGLSTTQALDLIERLDSMRGFDAIILRSFALCERAIERPRLRGRIWSCYILEPERDPDDADYRAAMARIAEGSKYVIVQSTGMRDLLERVVPAARGRTILLPPAIPADETPPTAPTRPVQRLLYTGKFHPFYPVERMIDFLGELRRDHPDLEFHVAGDKFMRIDDDPEYPARLESKLRTTPGVVWHGSLSREATSALVGEGGVALNLWDYRFGPRMNDLVVSTKLLDYAAARVPIVLTRTPTQAELLGDDYPLFVTEVDEALPALRRVLADGELYRTAADRAYAGSRAYTCRAVHALIAPYLRDGDAARAAVDAPAAS